MNRSNDVRIGIVGCGAIAEIYHLPALQKNPETTGKVILADTNAQQLAKLESKFDVAGTVDDFRALADRVDGVIVATPPASHYAICKWFLEQGIPVLCEKPLTESAVEAEELVAIAAEHGTTLSVNQTRRYFPTYQKIREIIKNGELGELRSITYHDGIEFDWPAASPHHFTPGAKGAWSDTGIHLLDSVCFWLDAEPKLVASWNDSYHDQVTSEEAGPEAMATARFEHEGCKIEIKVSRLGRLMNGFKIVGTKGTIEADAEEWAEVRINFSSGKSKKYRCGSRKTIYTDFAKPMIQDFVSVIQGSKAPAVPATSTVSTIALLEQAYTDSQPYPAPWDEEIRAGFGRLDTLNCQSDRSRRVLVTGASGFLGGRVVEVLHQTGFATPVAAIRQWSRAARAARFPVDIRLCDIQDQDAVLAATRDVDAIVHCAKSDDRASIIEGTRTLLEAAERNSVQNFVFLSTAEVYGPGVSGTVVESNDTNHTGRLYGDSKIDAEELCREFSDQHGITTSILRPSLIYGPHSTSWSIDIAKRLQSGNWGKFEEHGEGNANLIYVDDLVQAICLAMTRTGGSCDAFNVNGPEVLTWNQYFELFNAALELAPLETISATKSKLRTWLMGKVGFMADQVLNRFEDKLMEIYMRGGLASKLMKRIKGELNSTPSSGELHDLFARRVVYSDQKIQDQLGYRPQFGIKQGVDLTVEWLRLHEIAEASRQPSSPRAASDVAESRPFQELSS